MNKDGEVNVEQRMVIFKAAVELHLGNGLGSCRCHHGAPGVAHHLESEF